MDWMRKERKTTNQMKPEKLRKNGDDDEDTEWMILADLGLA